ncbi:MAG TPA: MBL fold metallo-hydrolase [Clostridiaceae bacterium]
MIFCSLYSGSSGNSIFVSSGSSRILIDAGLPGKRIEEALKNIGEDPKNLDGIFVTHEHSDHSKGLGVLSRRYDIPIYANELTWESLHGIIGTVKDTNIKIIDNYGTSVKDLDISCFSLPHDAVNPVGYSINHYNKKVCIATDLGFFSPEVKNNIKDADVLLLESNHDVEMLKFGPYPYVLKRRILSDKGHLSNESCGKAILEIFDDKHKNVILGHLSKTNNIPELAYQTVISILQENKIIPGSDISITIANRDNPSCYIEF